MPLFGIIDHIDNEIDYWLFAARLYHSLIFWTAYPCTLLSGCVVAVNCSCRYRSLIFGNAYLSIIFSGCIVALNCFVTLHLMHPDNGQQSHSWRQVPLTTGIESQWVFFTVRP